MNECKNKYDNAKCVKWASENECIKNPSWMWINCCSSCKGDVDYNLCILLSYLNVTVFVYVS